MCGVHAIIHGLILCCVHFKVEMRSSVAGNLNNVMLESLKAEKLLKGYVTLEKLLCCVVTEKETMQ